jgi:hypothetical protein
MQNAYLSILEEHIYKDYFFDIIKADHPSLAFVLDIVLFSVLDCTFWLVAF